MSQLCVLAFDKESIRQIPESTGFTFKAVQECSCCLLVKRMVWVFSAITPHYLQARNILLASSGTEGKGVSCKVCLGKTVTCYNY